MEVEQHIAFTISEIDRTLKFLGIQNECTSTLSQPSVTSSPQPFMSGVVTRVNGAAQTSSSSRVSCGVQKSCPTLSQGLQHSPQKRVASCQTEKGPNAHRCLEELAFSVGSTCALLEEKFRVLESSSAKIEALFTRVARAKCIASSSAKMLDFLQNRWNVGTIEREEMSARSAVVNCESDERNELTALRCGELVRLVAASNQKQLLKRLSRGPKKSIPTSLVVSVNARKETPSSSFSDLIMLLDECWRALDE
ncbi:hypothetical protein LSCM1_05433 [Leishmania martiniquensis]|uniref:Uncharacterized protein n=1 Tax=Leishmania martiniquensis TaxID=1580590 RepID=A0A836H0A6_9TRYP|nr:hypothetical protein LSCM1_05433 [Leishmania martiniquensis]